MSEVKSDLVYSKEHEWAEVRDTKIIRVGITDFAQSRLGDIVFVELPGVGASVEAGDSIGTIESVKTVSDLYTPVAGVVVKVNEALIDLPELVNEQPYGDGWIVEIETTVEATEALASLLSPEDYELLTVEE
ncbi:MAG: glycine cleavage system protein GcvH [Gorillibacterium sp.]|nr:glycine cleavage system protein GcvH [Gorillibacterium sp.]